MKAFIGALAAGALAVSGMVVAASPAEADDIPVCQYYGNADTACVAVATYDTRVHSVRDDGVCLYLRLPNAFGILYYFPDVGVSRNHFVVPPVIAYTGGQCEGNTVLDVGRAWNPTVNGYAYRFINVGNNR